MKTTIARMEKITDALTLATSNMKHQTFESYMQGEFMKEYYGSKDGYEGAYERWLADKDVADIMEYAEDWGKVIPF